jgi:DNA-binding CsgD family transcriptional regulator
LRWRSEPATIDEVAQAKGVRRSTARSQLEAILSKTGLHRQLDLARMIAGLPGARLA